jgi:hypothetical protein
MVISINAHTSGHEHTIAWISLQPDGSISVGLADRAFISPRFHARQFVWNAYNRVTVQYLVPHSPNELVAVVNPHLTFHPPVYFHLRANHNDELFAGIAEVEIMLLQDERVPWIRFASKPVRDIPFAQPPRDPDRTRVVVVPLASADISVGLSIDFVRPAEDRVSGSLIDEFVDCGRNRLHISCEARPAQQATLAWYHQY